MWFWLAILAWVAMIATFALRRNLVPTTSTRCATFLAAADRYEQQ